MGVDSVCYTTKSRLSRFSRRVCSIRLRNRLTRNYVQFLPLAVQASIVDSVNVSVHFGHFWFSRNPHQLGQAFRSRTMCSYSHTGTVRGHNYDLARACSFESSPRIKGTRWRVHKAVIMTRYGKFKTVVKIPTSVDNPSAQVFAEVNKYNFAKSVLRRCPDLANRIELVPVYHSNINKIGRGWNGGKRRGNFYKGATVAIQTRLQDPIMGLLKIGGCPTLPLNADDQIPLLALAHESYSSSGGECVITGIKGAKVRDDRGVMTYLVTSLTIHSLGKKFGETDRGFAGVEAYKNWNFPRQQTSQRRSGRNTGSQKNNVIPELASLPKRTLSSRSPEPLGPNLSLFVELLTRDPQLRHFLNEDSLRHYT